MKETVRGRKTVTAATALQFEAEFEPRAYSIWQTIEAFA